MEKFVGGEEKSCSVISSLCIILTCQPVDTPIHVKDPLDNVIMQMTSFMRKCLILSVL